MDDIRFDHGTTTKTPTEWRTLTFVQQNVDLETNVLFHLQFDAPKHDGDLRHFFHHMPDVQS